MTIEVETSTQPTEPLHPLEPLHPPEPLQATEPLQAIDDAARVRAAAIASVQQELAELRARSARPVPARTRRRRRPSGPSTVFTVRLSHDELAAVEGRAALLGLGPSVWARNVIRMALAERTGGVGSGPVPDAH